MLQDEETGSLLSEIRMYILVLTPELPESAINEGKIKTHTISFEHNFPI